jgi:very-short-patch-repair endonuclease
MNRQYKPELKPFARELRKSSTPGEIRLWCELLRGRKMFGYQFLRQLPIEKYVADFACRKLKLVIEVDGYSHQYRTEKDAEKDNVLNELGYTVLRFSESQVMKELYNVHIGIENYIEEFELQHPPVPQGGTSPFKKGGLIPEQTI